ncbi:C45 family autoproteolytic acyltransferase/hydolase [Glutamicibacter sp. X7]
MRLHSFRTTTLDPAARGQELAARFGTLITRNVRDYLLHFSAKSIPETQVRSTAENCFEALHEWDAGLALELRAQAEALEIELWQLSALNARTEVLAAAEPSREGECSTSAFLSGRGAPVTLQTWDWHPHLAADGLLHELECAGSRRVKQFTEFGINGKIGVNSDGLGLHFNILAHATDHPGGGVPVHSIARSVLERATTLDEAIDLTADASVCASTVLTVVTGGDRPEVASLEFSPLGQRIVNRTDNGWALHTNHFLDAGLFSQDVMPADSTTAERYDYLSQRTSGAAAASTAELLDLLASGPDEQPLLCMAPEPGKPATEQWETLLSIGLDTDNFTLQYSNTNPDLASRDGLLTF